MKSLVILMSVYNGSKYIEEQLMSIMNSKLDNLRIKLIIRDDGSTDNTLELVEKVSVKDNISLHLIKSKNIGVQKSFLELLKIAPDADFYAFCDQDDIWNSKKIVKMTNELKNFTFSPCVCISNYNIINKNSQIISKKIYSNPLGFSLLQILFANYVPGCIMMFNKSLIKILKRKPPINVPMHDLYVLLTAYLFGEIIHVPETLFSYRIHENNTVGMKKKHIRISNILKNQKKMLNKSEEESVANLALHFLDSYRNELSNNEKIKLDMVSSYKLNLRNKIKLLNEKEIYGYGLRGSLSLIECILLGKI